MATVLWDISAVRRMLDNIGRGPETRHELKQAVAMAGFSVERSAKQNLTRMVYSQPERGYRRTGTLRRSVHTAPPKESHSDDPERAKTSDLGGKKSGEVVGEAGDTLVVEVGSWLLYARRVHDGTGPRMTARPYLTDALTQNERFIEDTIVRGLTRALTHA